MKTILCVPFGNINIDSFLSFIRLVRECPQIEYVFTSTSSDAAISRNKIVNQFLDTDAEVALWIDTDQIFTPDDVKKIMETPGDVVSARIPSRSGKHFLCGFYKGEGHAFHAVHYKSEGLKRVEACGFGMVKVHRRVHEAMREEYGLSQFQNIYLNEKESNFTHISHDLVWSYRAHCLGFKIIFNNDVKVAHYGGIIDEQEMYDYYQFITSEPVISTWDDDLANRDSNALGGKCRDECGVQQELLCDEEGRIRIGSLHSGSRWIYYSVPSE